MGTDSLNFEKIENMIKKHPLNFDQICQTQLPRPFFYRLSTQQRHRKGIYIYFIIHPNNFFIFHFSFTCFLFNPFHFIPVYFFFYYNTNKALTTDAQVLFKKNEHHFISKHLIPTFIFFRKMKIYNNI